MAEFKPTRTFDFSSKIDYVMNPVSALESVMLSHQRAINKAAAAGDTPVQKFYEGSVVFVTGGTGFLGKLLIEKLLRTCAPSKIYVLIRQKSDKAPEDRLINALEDPLFDELRKRDINFAKKLVAVKGDVSEIGLSLSDVDRKRLTAEVNVIFHAAANVRFDTELKAALLSNARGTRETLRLAADCTQLRAFVYVSTAYAQGTRDRINGTVRERFYETPAPPAAIIKLAETLSVEKLNEMTPTLISGYPNTYTFSKAIAEEIIRTNGTSLPICVIRPTIVSCTNLDPVPGWLDKSCAYGPSGLILGVGIGLWHVAYMDVGIKLDFIPADIVNNSTIVAAWETARYRESCSWSPKIYTVCMSRNSLTCGAMLQHLVDARIKIAISKAVWYIFLFETKNKFLYHFMSVFLHYIPAYVVDGVCLIMGRPRMFVNIYKKVDKMSNVLGYFTNNQWKFEDGNVQTLFKSLSPTDKLIFDMDVTAVDWKNYSQFWCLGVKKYLVKEIEKSCDYALKKQKVFRIIHYIVSVLYLYLLWKLVNLCFDLFAKF